MQSRTSSSGARRSRIPRALALPGIALVMLAALVVAPRQAWAPPPPSPSGPIEMSVSVPGVAKELFFTSIKSLGTSSEVVQQKMVDPQGGESTTVHIPGRLNMLSAVLVHPLSSDAGLAAWRHLVETGDMKSARGEATISLFSLDTRQLIAKFELTGAWPSALSVSTGTDGAPIEEVTLAFDSLQRKQ